MKIIYIYFRLLIRASPIYLLNLSPEHIRFMHASQHNQSFCFLLPLRVLCFRIVYHDKIYCDFLWMITTSTCCKKKQLPHISKFVVTVYDNKVAPRDGDLGGKSQAE